MSEIGFKYQQKEIEFYKNKDFLNAEKYLLLSLEHGFCSSGDLTYLAKVYRKKKDYSSEIRVIKHGINMMKKSKEFGSKFDLLEKRITKVEKLKNMKL